MSTNEVLDGIFAAMRANNQNPVSYWLLLGVVMLLVQVMLGGITRLTGSGLSITEWDLVPGMIPPLNEQQWQNEFDQYRQTTQYALLNEGMSLSGFKNIFWWEYIHRLWGRMIGLAFLVPFVVFLLQKKINRSLGKKLIVAFVLGGLQGVIGWIMVLSGLKDQPWVNPLKLSIHLVFAVMLIGYVWWVALETMNIKKSGGAGHRFSSALFVLMVLILIQIFYGGLMAGHHAAMNYPTFPTFNGQWLPEKVSAQDFFSAGLINSTGIIQVIHRLLGMTIGVVVLILFFRSWNNSFKNILRLTMNLLPALVIIQITLGILTLINSLGKIPIALGVLHQLTGILLFLISLAAWWAAKKPRSTQPAQG